MNANSAPAPQIFSKTLKQRNRGKILTQRYHNPFAGIPLHYPVDQSEMYSGYTQSGGYSVINQSPFPRMVDLWFTGLSIAMRKGVKPMDLSGHRTKKEFGGGELFDSDSWRVQAIMLIGIAFEDSVDIVGDPRRIISICDGLAASGVPLVVDMLKEGDQRPIWNLSDSLADMLSNK